MGYAEKALLPGETIKLRARLSAVPLMLSFASLFGAIMLSIAAKVEPILLAAGLVWALIAIVRVVNVALALATTTIVVTDRRLLGKTGLIARSSVELLLTKLESLEVGQSVAGRLCGYGNIAVAGGAERGVKFSFIKSPLELRRACMALADQAQKTTPSSGAAVPPTGSAPLFEVQLIDRAGGPGRWIEVRAANAVQARELAAATGESIGEARLKSIA